MFNTGNDLFFTLGPKELYKTVGYKELAFIYGSTVKPYEVTTKWINRFRYQVQNGTPNRTLQNNAEKEGSTSTLKFITPLSYTVKGLPVYVHLKAFAAVILKNSINFSIRSCKCSRE